ncbi:hypothetical protein IWQ62_001327 [Dispira parvispora]|uniref:Uncharacterized protein n=1 Tax=Dispira parvispora TaxID=1520584 RepID=A0A9W8E3Z8_9FUNG|nr:hypothetical protein IWQ62_001327 [Dispira parvispora]
MVAIRLTVLFALTALVVATSAATLPSKHVRVAPRQLEGGDGGDGGGTGFGWGFGGW